LEEELGVAEEIADRAEEVSDEDGLVVGEEGELDDVQ
jgi:hypothetical protein